MKKFDTIGDALIFAKKHGAEVIGHKVNFSRSIGLKVLGVVDFLNKTGNYFVTFER